MMKLPKCEWCKKPMHKLNNDGVYECRDCKVVIHYTECTHERFKAYHTPYMRSKHCLICGDWFDQHALMPLSKLEKRRDNRRSCADRLDDVIKAERARGKK